MEVSEFDYYLPEDLIAQHPVEPRDSSRMMVLNRLTGKIEHKLFNRLPEFLRAGDALVLNNTRVLPVRLYGIKAGGGASIEVVLLKRCAVDTWEALVKPGKKIKPGHHLLFEKGLLEAEVLDFTGAGGRILKFNYQGVFEEILDRIGQMPLPPYIKARLDDRERYQTIYARHNGSAAAPTAGLHFTPDLLQELNDKGVEIVYLLLHVGLGTFRPVKVGKVEEHQMHAEYFSFGQEEAERLNGVRRAGGRVVAVGTTSARTLETVADDEGTFHPLSGWTDIFIYPGYEFRGIDALITNFHLPKSTLLMLVSALAGRENIQAAYEQAVKERYQFFSFGDAMFIL